jgi:hypothetical protein
MLAVAAVVGAGYASSRTIDATLVPWESVAGLFVLVAFVAFAPGRGVSLPTAVVICSFVAFWRPVEPSAIPQSTVRVTILIDVLVTTLAILLVRELTLMVHAIGLPTSGEHGSGEPGGRRAREPRPHSGGDEPHGPPTAWEPLPANPLARMLSAMVALLESQSPRRARADGLMLLIMLTLAAVGGARRGETAWDGAVVLWWMAALALWLALVYVASKSLAWNSRKERR